jgi:hypothetical protein
MVGSPGASAALFQKGNLTLCELVPLVSGKFRQAAVVKRCQFAIHGDKFRRCANRLFDWCLHSFAIDGRRCCVRTMRKAEYRCGAKKNEAPSDLHLRIPISARPI